MDRIISALKSFIKEEAGIMAILAPQAAGGNTASITLFFSGVDAAGSCPGGGKDGEIEEVTFQARYSISGTHEKWVDTAIRHSRRLLAICSRASIALYVPVEQGYSLKVRTAMAWSRAGAGKFEYPSEDEQNMPVSYVEDYHITIRYPASFIGGRDEGDG